MPVYPGWCICRIPWWYVPTVHPGYVSYCTPLGMYPTVHPWVHPGIPPSCTSLGTLQHRGWRAGWCPPGLKEGETPGWEAGESLKVL